MNYDELCECLVYAASAYREEISDETAMVYFDQLRDYTVEQLNDAMIRHVKTADRFPTVNQLITQMGPREVYGRRIRFEDN